MMTKEQRDEMRQKYLHEPDAWNESGIAVIPVKWLLPLLAAADERDRLKDERDAAVAAVAGRHGKSAMLFLQEDAQRMQAMRELLDEAFAVGGPIRYFAAENPIWDRTSANLGVPTGKQDPCGVHALIAKYVTIVHSQQATPNNPAAAIENDTMEDAGEYSRTESATLRCLRCQQEAAYCRCGRRSR